MPCMYHHSSLQERVYEEKQALNINIHEDVA